MKIRSMSMSRDYSVEAKPGAAFLRLLIPKASSITRSRWSFLAFRGTCYWRGAVYLTGVLSIGFFFLTICETVEGWAFYFKIGSVEGADGWIVVRSGVGAFLRGRGDFDLRGSVAGSENLGCEIASSLSWSSRSSSSSSSFRWSFFCFNVFSIADSCSSWPWICLSLISSL